MSTEGRKAIVKTGKAALAVAAPEVAIPAAIADKAVQAAERALTGDIVTVRKVEIVGTKKHPIVKETEIHYNLVAAGLGALLVGAAGFVGVTAWEGRNGGQFFGGAPGLRDNYARFLDAHPKLVERLRLHRR